MSADRELKPFPVRNLVPGLDARVSAFADDFAQTIGKAMQSQRERNG